MSPLTEPRPNRHTTVTGRGSPYLRSLAGLSAISPEAQPVSFLILPQDLTTAT